jgi:hypothetical protein
MNERLASPAPPNPATPPPAPKPATLPAKSRPTLSRFWLGFALAFLTLSVMSCGALFLATGVTGLDLTELQNSEPRWQPPQVTATPTPAPTTVAEQPTESDGLFRTGDRVRNIAASRVNIRATPGYLGKPDGDIIGQVPPGAQVEIVGGRTTADNLSWWLVRYVAPDGGVIQGWMAEATAGGVQIMAP